MHLHNRERSAPTSEKRKKISLIFLINFFIRLNKENEGILCNFAQNSAFPILSVHNRAEFFFLWDSAIDILPPLFKVVSNDKKILNPSTRVC